MIALIGASGKIGAEIIRTLQRVFPGIEIKYGYFSHPKSKDTLWERVNADDAEDLDHFIGKSRLVINAAGPSDRLSENVMESAIRTGASLIDVGHSVCYEMVGELRPGQHMVYACGAVPGIIGWILRRTALGFDRVRSMIVNIGLREELTMTAARDLVTASQLPDGKGRISASGTESVPFIGNAVYRYQFTDAESRGIDRLLGVGSSSWYMVRDTDDYEKLFNRPYRDKEEMAETLYRFCRISMMGKEDYLRFVVEMNGEKAGTEKSMTAYLNGSSGSVVSGRVSAAMACALLDGRISERFPVRLALLKDWQELWEYVEKTNPFTTDQIYSCTLREMTEEESGEL